MADLYLHIGHNKTGSSYIQSSLARSTDVLLSAGISYPIDKRRQESAGSGRISNGNWLEFSDFLETPNVEKGRYLFSSEMIYPTLVPNHPLHNKVYTLFKLFDHVKVLLLIRDPVSHSCSAYQQSIKRGGSTNSLQQYIKSYNTIQISRSVIEALLSLQNVDLTVINYSRKPNVIQVMEEWLNLEMGDLSHPPHSVVNRSLTRAELELQRQINIHMGSNAGHLFADLACNTLPNVKSDMVRPSIEAQEALWQRLASDIDFINKTVPEAERIDANRDIYLSTQKDSSLFSFSVEQLNLIAESICDKIRKLDNLDIQITKQREQNSALHAGMDVLRTRNEELRHQMSSLTARSKEKITELMEVQSSLAARNNSLRESNASLRAGMASLKSKNEELTQQIFDQP